MNISFSGRVVNGDRRLASFSSAQFPGKNCSAKEDGGQLHARARVTYLLLNLRPGPLWGWKIHPPASLRSDH
jgi:hypothetical protein